MDQRWARAWFAVTAASVVAGIAIQLPISATTPAFFGGSPLNRALNTFSFFTIQSNVIVGVTCLLLAIRLDRTSTAFAAFRLTGVVAIAVTGIVYHVALSGLLEMDTWSQVANQFQHTVVPVLAVVGWLAFGPRRLTSGRIVALTAAFPLLYIAFTTIRGPLASDFYPYPFADVRSLGYLRVIVNAVWIIILFLGISAGTNLLDKRLSGTREIEPERPLTAAAADPLNP